MTRTEFAKLEAGATVTVYAFGVHAGVVVGKNPTVKVQGRTFVAEGWVKVRIAGRPDYNGTFKDVDVTPRLTRSMRKVRGGYTGTATNKHRRAVLIFVPTAEA